MTKTTNHIIGRKLNILWVKIMEDKNVTVISNQVNDSNSQLAGSSMTKAGRLAMELSHEKKRLKQELEELQTEYDEIKPTTPTGTTDWYVKWTASFFILIGMSIRGVEGLQFYDLIMSMVGVTGWLIVGLLWKDRALILLNGIGVALLLRTLIELI